MHEGRGCVKEKIPISCKANRCVGSGTAIGGKWTRKRPGLGCWLGTRSFDGRGNYSLGIKEQMIFPEINYDEIEQIHGMDITFVTTADRDDVAFALLKELGMPFRTDERRGGKAAATAA